MAAARSHNSRPRKGRPCCQSKGYYCPAARARASKRQTGTMTSSYGHRHSRKLKRSLSMQYSGVGNPNYGKKHDSATLEAMSKARSGKCTGERNHNFGKPRPLFVRRKVSTTRIARGVAKGAANPNWRDGRSLERRDARRSDMNRFRYREWRRHVFKRDHHKCVDCGSGRELQADHVKPYVDFPKLRLCTSKSNRRRKTCQQPPRLDVPIVRMSSIPTRSYWNMPVNSIPRSCAGHRKRRKLSKPRS